MKKFVLLIPFLILGTKAVSSPYDDNSFGRMPHQQILTINTQKCMITANATGDFESGKKCIDYQHKSFEKLQYIYSKHNITASSWSLCIGEAKIPDSYDYLTMLGCMKVVKSICPENPDGSWVNYNLCRSSIESGAWINNPKVYEPYHD